MANDWKGRPSVLDQCGAQYKIGLVVHLNTRCQLKRGHLGKHISGSMLNWPRDNDEMDELMDQIDKVQTEAQKGGLQ